ncbi:hypothetical protein ACUH78_19690, partial [Thauera sp. ZXT1-4]|uniref:hypothetical protein n=1 Tax=Thauera sp. ZXT1-4 TaxID=3460294 RepID=UPI0040408E13
IDGVPLARYRVFLDAFGRRPAGATLSLDVTGAGGARRVSFRLVTVRDEFGRTRDGGSNSSRLLGIALTGYPLIFLAVASVVLLQRPGDRAAW